MLHHVANVIIPESQSFLTIPKPIDFSRVASDASGGTVVSAFGHKKTPKTGKNLDFSGLFIAEDMGFEPKHQIKTH